MVNKPDHGLPDKPGFEKPDHGLPEPEKPGKPDHELPKPVEPTPEEKKKAVEAKKTAKEKEEQKAECLQKITDILAANGNLESNIPLTSEYWGLLNVYRTL